MTGYRCLSSPKERQRALPSGDGMGCHYVVAVIPCHGVDALMLGPDREEYSATMEAMVLTADGVIRPLEYHRDEGSWEQECSFIGFTPRRDG